MANCADPDQMPHSVTPDLGLQNEASDQDLQSFQRSICPNTYFCTLKGKNLLTERLT